MNAVAPNPIVATTPLRAYPGWEVREYQDGHYDAAQTNGPGLSGGCETFAEAVDFARVQSHPVFAAFSPETRNRIAASNAARSEPVYPEMHNNLGGVWSTEASDLGWKPGRWPLTLVATCGGEVVEGRIAEEGHVVDGDLLYVDYVAKGKTLRVYND